MDGEKIETQVVEKNIFTSRLVFFVLNVLFHGAPRLAKLSKARKKSDPTVAVVFVFEAAAATAAADEDHTKGGKSS